MKFCIFVLGKDFPFFLGKKWVEKESLSKKENERMTEQVYSMGKNREKESGHEERKVLVQTLVSIIEGLEIFQIAAGYYSPSF